MRSFLLVVALAVGNPSVALAKSILEVKASEASCLPGLRERLSELRRIHDGLQFDCFKGPVISVLGPPGLPIFHNPKDFVLSNLDLFLWAPSSASRVELKGLRQTYKGYPVFERGLTLDREVYVMNHGPVRIPGMSGPEISPNHPAGSKESAPAILSRLSVSVEDTSNWTLIPKLEVSCEQAIELAKSRYQAMNSGNSKMAYECKPEPFVMHDYCFQGPALVLSVRARGGLRPRTLYVDGKSGFFCPNQ